MKDAALSYYMARRGNCAQSVASAWHEKTSRNAGLSDLLSGCGGGRAPEGVCGALHAAQVILGGEAASVIVADEFRKASGGYVRCRDIRSAGKLPCTGCVEVAAGLLEDLAVNGKQAVTF